MDHELGSKESICQFNGKDDVTQMTETSNGYSCSIEAKCIVFYYLPRQEENVKVCKEVEKSGDTEKKERKNQNRYIEENKQLKEFLDLEIPT